MREKSDVARVVVVQVRENDVIDMLGLEPKLQELPRKFVFGTHDRKRPAAIMKAMLGQRGIAKVAGSQAGVDQYPAVLSV